MTRPRRQSGTARRSEWYEKAQAAHPDDLSVMRRVAEFFIQTRQTAEVEAQLAGILNRGAKVHGAATVAWARRTLAAHARVVARPAQGSPGIVNFGTFGPAGKVAEEAYQST